KNLQFHFMTVQRNNTFLCSNNNSISLSASFYLKQDEKHVFYSTGHAVQRLNGVRC
ncbi:hypothetical protein L9F63_027739, partial [Diploptera punctata]